ncbi:MAG: hypothetical protein CME70_03425 [Halobacteriovorax sp.]|nr:hypothetical protein [Halobacteriovorax sp.]MBK23035.1 hypothetical protein [Halobacteriovorax sp.]|tara:strand:- start:45738 stop:46136 length:399 start_codon:yes stop_codon:yes gene_type:complete
MDSRELHKNEIVLPSASCGIFGLGEDYQVEPYLLDEIFETGKPHIMDLRATGDSMASIILPGDTLRISRKAEIKSGSIVVAVWEGKFICKYYFRRNDAHYLVSANKKYSDLRINKFSLETIFKVVAQFRFHT